LIDRLLEHNLGRVILLDDFNDYYSPIIKQRNVALLEERYPTRVFDGSFIIIRGSINDQELLTMIFNKYKITHIAHLAALAGVRSSTSQTGKYMEINYAGTQILLDLAVSHKITQFVFASTSSVYGQTDKLPFIETDSCAEPLSPYAATKRAAEILAHVYYHMHGLNVTILRLFNVYGPRGRPDMMPFKLMRACIDSSCIIDVFDDGEIKRDWTYIDDVIDAFINALKQQLGYEIINIGCGNPIKLSTFIEHIENLSGKHISKRSMESHKTEPSITYCDNSKARKLLNFHPKTNVRDGLEKTWHWFRDEYGSIDDDD
jgi:UDP-glucuronate 4-epimerase